MVNKVKDIASDRVKVHNSGARSRSSVSLIRDKLIQAEMRKTAKIVLKKDPSQTKNTVTS